MYLDGSAKKTEGGKNCSSYQRNTREATEERGKEGLSLSRIREGEGGIREGEKDSSPVQQRAARRTGNGTQKTGQEHGEMDA